jgi:hypothetical protein
LKTGKGLEKNVFCFAVCAKTTNMRHLVTVTVK